MARKQMIHRCERCKKEMEYKDKSMLYIYKVIPHYHYERLTTTKKYAINLCNDCRIYVVEMLKLTCDNYEGGAEC